MAKALKNKRRDKSIRKLKSGHLWVPFVTFTILFVAIAVMLLAIVTAFMEYAVASKFDSENRLVRYMAQLYDETQDTKVLEMSGRPFLLTNGNGEIRYVYGENTCSMEGGEIKLTFETGRVFCYMDKENGLFYVDGDELGINGRYLWTTVNDSINDFTSNLNVPDINVNVDRKSTGEGISSEVYISDEMVEEMERLGNETMIYFPMWMSVPVQDGNLIAKVYFFLNINDAFLAAGIFGIFIGVGVIAVIIMLINLIRSVSQQRRGLRVLTTDFVTGGHNWMWFLLKGEKTLRSRLSAKKRFAIVNVTFVEYRTFCVCHSVEAGDEILVQMHRLLSRDMRKDEICVHTTSSNFAMLLRITDEEQLKARLEAYLNTLHGIGKDSNLHFQIGATCIPIWVNSKGRIVRRKDLDIEAEYNNACAARNTMASRSESGIVFFDEKLVEEKRWITTVTEHQRQALENEEFAVYYQPKYDPVTEQLRGAEALVRWISPEFGFVPPGKFIPIFEDNGFITEIDHYMLQHVAKDQRAWLDAGLKCVPVSVNVSRAHFIESDLAEQIRDIVDSQGTPHEYIEIELTESAFFDDKNALISTITRLQSYGFSVSMDDFGSGYSSLNSLKDMPLDVLKLDAEFFRGENAGERGKIVVSEAIRLAKDLNMRVVAEGVEEKGQVEFLASQGCDMIQGFVFAKPMGGADYVDRMKKNMDRLNGITGNTENTGSIENVGITGDPGESDVPDNMDEPGDSENPGNTDIKGGNTDGQDI